MSAACDTSRAVEPQSLEADAVQNIQGRAHARLCRTFLIVAVSALVAATPILAQDSSSQLAGFPEDWTHHHSMFGDAGTAEQAIQNGTYEQWLKIVQDPRYQLQRAKRFVAARTKSTPVQQNNFSGYNDAGAADAPADENTGTGFALETDGKIPRGLTKALIPPPQANADGSHEFHHWPNPPPDRGRRRHNGEKLDWSETLGSGGSLGLGNYPAKYSFSTSSASCTDWVVYGTGVAGGSTQATILAYTNLYAGTCSGSVPSMSWAFNTGTGSTILTSPVLSLDGTQIAFVQNSSAGVASLIVLKWSASGTLTAPTALSSQASASAYRSCAAPCMYSMNFSSSASDSGSSAWYDYNSDSVWVGDDKGNLHKFTGIFAGSPAEVTTAGWPAAVSASPLSSPVLDPVTGNVFVGDYNLTADSACTPSSSTSISPCGFLYSCNSSTGTLNAKSAQLDFNFGIVDTPILDEFAGRMYVPVGSDGEIGSSTKCGTDTPCAGIFQLSTSFASGATGTEATVGPGYDFLLSGTFDNAYLTSANASSPTGHIYVVGNTGPANNALYQVSITANVMSTTSVVGPTVALNYTNGYYAAGLGVSEFFNNTTDYIFLGTIAFGNYSGCGTTPSISIGCVVGFNVTSGSISGSTAPAGSSPAAGGASGIVVDNSGSATGESNIYFSALSNQTCATSGGSSGCAIQISQSAP
jgi:hypothetical protein